MSTPPPPSSSTTTDQARLTDAYSTFKHNASIFMLVLAPVLITLPPRKLDLYTFSLAGAFVASANQITVERTGRGILTQFGYRYGRKQGYQDTRMLEEEEVWRRRSSAGWKEQRLREEQEKLDQGEGYGGMIMDQIWEVWNQDGKKKDGVERVGEEKKGGRDQR